MLFIDTIREFMLIEAASGYERNMARALSRRLANDADETSVDRAGNVIAKFQGTDALAPTVMVFAHMDQLGFMIRKIGEDGLIQVDRLGGIPEKALPALAVSVGGVDGTYTPGVIGVKSHHVTPPEEKYKVDPVGELTIDIGASSKRQVLENGIRVGCPVVYRPSFTQLLNNRVCGTAVDDRCGCAALTRIAERLRQNRHPSTVYLVGTVWEEFNLRGATLAARAVKPDIAICLDVTIAGDTPELKNKFDLALGGGPSVSLYNFHGRGTLNGTIAHPGLYRLAASCAEEAGIPLQEFSGLGMLTDAAYVQWEGGYIACLDMGFPARYTHTPVEEADVSDVALLSDLVSRMIGRIDAGFQTSRFDLK